MSRVSAALTALAARRPRHLLGLTAVVTVVLASFIPQAELSNDATAFSPDTAEVEALNDVRDRFDDTSTATFQLVVTGDDVVSADGVTTAAAIADTAQASFGAALAAGGQPAIISYADPAISAARESDQALEALEDDAVDRLQQERFDQLPSGRADLIDTLIAGDDVTTADAGLVLIQLNRAAFEDNDAIAAAQRDVVDQIDALDLPLDVAPFSLELVRAPDDSFQQEVAQLFALAAVVILVVLAIVLRARRGPVLSRTSAVRRSVADMGLSIVAVLIAIIWNQGIGVLLGPNYLGLIGQPTPPTQIVPILLLALGVDYAIHTQGRYREEISATGVLPAQVVSSLGRTVGVALVLSMVTTGIGFLTNLASPLPAIQDLGILAATGIGVVLLTNLTFLVAARLLLDQRGATRGRLARTEVAPSEANPLARVATVGLRPALRAPVVVLGVTGLVTAASAFAFTQLDTEFSSTDFLPDGDPSKAALLVLEESFDGGLGETTEILVTGDQVLTPASHNAQVDVETALTGRTGVVEIDGRPDLVSPVSELAAAQRIADGDEQIAAIETATAAGLRTDGTIAEDGDVQTVYAAMAAVFPNVDGVVDPDPADPAARLAVLTQSEAFGVDLVNEAMDVAIPVLTATGAEAIATSDAIVNDQTTTALSDSSVSGLLITIGAVTLLLAAVYWFRSRQAGLGALVVAPVAAVVLNVFGLMWVFGIPFDPITAIVSALIVGVGVDFCIHLGERFVEDLEGAGGDVAVALRRALQHTGAALAGSATTTTLGFAVLTFGSIVPFQRLGLVTIFAMILSLAAVVFVLPAALVLYGRRQRPTTDGEDRAEVTDRDPEESLVV